MTSLGDPELDVLVALEFEVSCDRCTERAQFQVRCHGCDENSGILCLEDVTALRRAFVARLLFGPVKCPKCEHGASDFGDAYEVTPL